MFELFYFVIIKNMYLDKYVVSESIRRNLQEGDASFCKCTFMDSGSGSRFFMIISVIGFHPDFTHHIITLGCHPPFSPHAVIQLKYYLKWRWTRLHALLPPGGAVDTNSTPTRTQTTVQMLNCIHDYIGKLMCGVLDRQMADKWCDNSLRGRN